MPLDHIATAQEFERTARTITNMANALGTSGAKRAANHSNAFLLGQADWHQDQAVEQAQTATSAEMQDLTKAAAQQLLNSNQK